MSDSGPNGKQERDDPAGEEELSREEASQLRQRPPPTLVEWSVRSVSLALLLALTGYLVWSGFQPAVDARFSFSVESEGIEAREHGWVVPVAVTHTGSEGLEDLGVRLQLVDAAGGVVEEETLAFPLVGSNETLHAEYWFDHDPEAHRLRFDVVGYTLP